MSVPSHPHIYCQHAWFSVSKSSKDDSKHDWYIWRPGRVANGEELPPTQRACSRERDPTTGEYYLHLFVSKQPDLNWDNPIVRSAVWDVMRLWVRRGYDGFRLDVINFISETDGLPDALLADHTQYY
ncbi:glycoside hydrolase [Suillus decipiens]|nr:glycoside hydrolase [Suillus decipiens]